MKKISRKEFLALVKKDCNGYQEIKLVCETYLRNETWYVTIVESDVYYLVYRNILDEIEQVDAFYMLEDNALHNAIIAAKRYI